MAEPAIPKCHLALCLGLEPFKNSEQGYHEGDDNNQ
jgi:hypothetical protein